MQLAVFIEPLPGRSGFSARMTAPLELSAEGETAEEAHRSLAALLQRRLEEGLELRTLSVPGHDARGTEPGWLADDELTREWRQHIEEYRAECDAADRQRLGMAPAEAEKQS